MVQFQLLKIQMVQFQLLQIQMVQFQLLQMQMQMTERIYFCPQVPVLWLYSYLFWHSLCVLFFSDFNIL